MAFNADLVARRLVQNAGISVLPKNKNEEFNKILALNQAGLSPRAIFDSLKDLIDNCDDDEKAIKLQALKFASQLQELLREEETVRSTPTIILNITGDNARINGMLCPNLATNG